MKKTTVKIALDGPSGSGKSTMAKLLAKDMGFVYIDTGALYRTIGLYCAKKGVAADDLNGIIALLPEINIKMQLIDGGGVVYLNGRKIGDEIRTPEITKYASDVSKIPEVRSFLLELQRMIADENNTIMDGRDIGTVILPDAQVKIFMYADDKTRARRRYNELIAKGYDVKYEDVLSDMMKRDKNDRERQIAPAIPADDAIIHDNSGMSIEENFEALKKIINEKLI
ncbi:MAG: (d)CMP kinase [Eubacteriales bacterium]|nr:(d)CMP kinase [Eubacteriales bacterium]MDD4421946.1 (d)CMP kinase [Eubacteriales bacterium]HBR32315.1 (d)CMP kinase [Clostridiales bacterium]